MTTIKKAKAEARLVRKAIKGNRSTLKQIVENNINFCYSVSLVLLENRGLAKKVVKDTMKQVSKNINNLTDARIFKVWLYDNLKQRVFKVKSKLKPGDEFLKPKDLVVFRDTAIIDLSKKSSPLSTEARLEQLIFLLPEDEREIIALVDFEGLNCTEVALLLDMTATEVREKLYRAKKWLARNLNMKQYRDIINLNPHYDKVIQLNAVSREKIKAENKEEQRLAEERKIAAEVSPSDEEAVKKPAGLFNVNLDIVKE